MKTMRMILLVVAVFGAITAVSAQKATKTVVYNAELHCGSCKAKIEKNIPYEKGVKDLKVDMEKNTVTVTFREDKNTTEGIKKAIEAQDIPVSGFQEITTEASKASKKEKEENHADHKHQGCCDKHE